MALTTPGWYWRGRESAVHPEQATRCSTIGDGPVGEFNAQEPPEGGWLVIIVIDTAPEWPLAFVSRVSWYLPPAAMPRIPAVLSTNAGPLNPAENPSDAGAPRSNPGPESRHAYSTFSASVCDVKTILDAWPWPWPLTKTPSGKDRARSPVQSMRVSTTTSSSLRRMTTSAVLNRCPLDTVTTMTTLRNCPSAIEFTSTSRDEDGENTSTELEALPAVSAAVGSSTHASGSNASDASTLTRWFARPTVRCVPPDTRTASGAGAMTNVRVAVPVEAPTWVATSET
eukprot:2486030-Rhodomonas_salina.1